MWLKSLVLLFMYMFVFLGNGLTILLVLTDNTHLLNLMICEFILYYIVNCSKHTKTDVKISLQTEKLNGKSLLINPQYMNMHSQ